MAELGVGASVLALSHISCHQDRELFVRVQHPLQKVRQNVPFSSSPKDYPDAGFKPSGEDENKDAEDLGNEASTGKTYSSSSNNSFGLVPIASPTISLFHDDPYIKVMHAYYDKESPILPPTIVPPSSMLSPMFNPQKFFLHEELLPLKKRGCDRSSSSTSALPQAFEIGESSRMNKSGCHGGHN
ncbi:hypothetical protein Tco_1243707 [Tanacetum coccineum]